MTSCSIGCNIKTCSSGEIGRHASFRPMCASMGVRVPPRAPNFNQTKTTKKTMSNKRGRKAGSGSFVSVTLADLNATLKPHARVIIWGRYAQMLGLSGKPVDAKPDALVAAVTAGQTDLELETFGEEKAAKPAAEKPDIFPKVSVELENFED